MIYNEHFTNIPPEENTKPNRFTLQNNFLTLAQALNNSLQTLIISLFLCYVCSFLYCSAGRQLTVSPHLHCNAG